MSQESSYNLAGCTCLSIFHWAAIQVSTLAAVSARLTRQVIFQAVLIAVGRPRKTHFQTHSHGCWKTSCPWWLLAEDCLVEDFPLGMYFCPGISSLDVNADPGSGCLIQKTDVPVLPSCSSTCQRNDQTKALQSSAMTCWFLLSWIMSKGKWDKKEWCR